MWEQYTEYMGHVVHLDLGPSYKYIGRSVNDIIGESFPVSAELGFGALVVALIGGVLAGVISALRPNSWIDYLVTLFSTLGISVPTFIIGAVLVYWFGFIWPIFPVALWKGPEYMILPVLTLAADYGQWLAACEALLAGQDAAARAAIFGGTARRFYGLEG